MRFPKPTLACIALFASLSFIGCSGSDSGRQPSTVSNNRPEDHAGSGEEDRTTSYSQPGSDTPPSPTDPDTDSDSASIDPNPPGIEGASGLSIDRDYRFELSLNGSSVEFRGSLPENDRTGYQGELFSASNVEAQLTCENSKCSRSHVVLNYGHRQARIAFRHLKMKALTGELQKSCAIPIFFDYELDGMIGAAPLLRSSIEQYRKIDTVHATLSHTEDWDRARFDTVTADLFAHHDEVLSLTDSGRSGVKKMRVAKSRIPTAQSFSYGVVGEGDAMTLDFLKFHFPTLGSGTEELCYHLPLIPEVLED